MSRFATQKERLEFIDKQITGHHWIFNGPEERAIVQEMAAAGHFAAFVDQFPQIPMAERLSRRKYKRDFSGVAALDRLKRN